MSTTQSVGADLPGMEPGSPGSSGRAAQHSDRRERWLTIAEAWSLAGLLLATALFFTLWGKTSGTFPTTANFQVMVGNQAVLAIVALAALIPLVCREFDLSVGAIAGLAAVFVAEMMSKGTPVLLCVLVGIALGALIGLVNALLVTRARVNGVIATLGVATMLAGVVHWKTQGRSLVTNIPESVTSFGDGTTLGVPQPAWAMVVIALLVYYLLNHTVTGRSIYALGANPTAARLVGLPTKRLLGLTFVLSGALAGAAGVLQVARAGGADPQVGENFTLPALAAAFLSAAAVKPGRYNVGGVIVAIFFLAVLNTGLNLSGAAQYVSDFVNGGALVLGVALAAYLSRGRAT
ncbi:MAG: ribose transport system permease protein [Thermoleophilaceae bacterium]|jgi:ribose transport system permease protein|nr:ribose transport system permease protein [Thermoleophilaceae bacterium]